MYNSYQQAMNNKTRISLAALLSLGILHRAIQWWLLGPQVRHLAFLNSGPCVVQLLPPEIWQHHFAYALLYLQQTPPIPNLIYGLVAISAQHAASQAAILILWSGLLSAITSVLLTVLLINLRVPKVPAFFVSATYLFSSDLLLNEYAALGQLFYEQLTMVELLCTALCAVSLSRRPSTLLALGLGTSAAALALTRSIFSYVEIPILVWVVLTLMPRNMLRLACFYLAPVLVLHGGWATKQVLIQKDWQWATSTWGGANIAAGELKRALHSLKGDSSSLAIESLIRSEREHQAPCRGQWGYFLAQENAIGLFGTPDLAEHYIGTESGPSLTASAIDAMASEDRGSRIPLDSAAFRELSACVENAYLRFWLRNPWHAAKGWWQSYGMFWSPIYSFAEVFPTVLIPGEKIWKEGYPVWTPQGRLWEQKHYYIRNNRFPLFLAYDESTVEPATVLALPLLPGTLAFMGMLFIHLLPILAGLTWMLSKRTNINMKWPHGYSCLILLYLYAAGVSNLVEYGENMRFRLAVEPLIWAIALSAIYAGLKTMQNAFPLEKGHVAQSSSNE